MIAEGMTSSMRRNSRPLDHAVMRSPYRFQIVAEGALILADAPASVLIPGTAYERGEGIVQSL